MNTAAIAAPGDVCSAGPTIAPKYLALFWSKVRKPDGDGCWLWTGKPMADKFGYGRAQVAPGVTILAHRASWMINIGPLRDDECVLHHCDNPPCVRPDHLFKGDRGDNNRDTASKGRHRVQRDPATRPVCPPEKLSRGEAHYKARLKRRQVREIRERYAAGEPPISLKRVFNITDGCLYSLLTGRSWKHVGGPIQEKRS